MIEWKIEMYDDRTAKVGDTVIFEWSYGHNVYVHPSGNCTWEDRSLVGLESPASYTFTNIGQVVFACDIGSEAQNHCTYGQIVTFKVASADSTNDPTKAPTKAPTRAPTRAQTKAPTKALTYAPAGDVSRAPTIVTGVPTNTATAATKVPTKAPTIAPKKAPTEALTKAPTKDLIKALTKAPTKAPTEAPTKAPTKGPTEATKSATPSISSAGTRPSAFLLHVPLVLSMILLLSKSYFEV